jgi:hypothetical protein
MCHLQIPELMDLISERETCGLEAMKILGKTLLTFRIEEIVKIRRFTKSNGIKEGNYQKLNSFREAPVNSENL